MSRTALLVAALVALLAAAPAHAAVKPPKQRNARPAATLTWAPSAPHSGDMVVFNAATSDADGDAVSVAWDLDGDGLFESTAPSAAAWWMSPGPHTFTVRLTDARGAVTVLRRRVEVADAPPVAAFTFTPDSPLTGGAVTFTSQSADPDGGTLALQQSWDLDGDGQYDDATGRTATATFPAGDHVVRLLVRDGAGGETVSEQHVVVATPAPIAANSAASARPLSPFPVVRLRGRITPRGVRVSLLSVWGPRGARISVRCAGAGCPRGVIRRTVPRRGSRAVTVRAMDRLLQPGPRLQVRVTQPGLVGKYVGFRIRAHAEPLRRARFLLPGRIAQARCR